MLSSSSTSPTWSSSRSIHLTPPHRVVVELLDEFEALFDQYARLTRKTVEGREEVAQRLRTLRDHITCRSIRIVCRHFRRLLQKEPSLVVLDDPEVEYMCFGDLHGSLSDLALLRNTFWRDRTLLRDTHFVFLGAPGDYVDRGIHGFEVSIYLILVKLVFPQSFTILRGNHEYKSINEQFFLLEARVKFGQSSGEKLWKLINECFTMLPYVALIHRDIFCCHGGVPRDKDLDSLDDIAALPKGVYESPELSLPVQLVWNDFYTAEELQDSPRTRMPKLFVKNWARGEGYFVGLDGAEQFMARFGLSYIVRAHQYNLCATDGFGVMTLPTGGKVITVFSNSSYSEHPNTINNTACTRISRTDRRVEIVELARANDPDYFNQSEVFEEDEGLREMKFKDIFDDE